MLHDQELIAIGTPFITMMFCPQCKGLMISSGGQLKCKKCGYIREINETDRLKKTDKRVEKEITIVDEEDKIATLPTATIKCPDCDCTTALRQDLARVRLIRQVYCSGVPSGRISFCCFFSGFFSTPRGPIPILSHSCPYTPCLCGAGTPDRTAGDGPTDGGEVPSPLRYRIRWPHGVGRRTLSYQFF